MRRLAGTLALLVLWCPSGARAEDLPSAEAAGMGGTATATPRDNAAITLSPATIALVPRYDFQGSFVGGPDGTLRWNASAVDGRTSDKISFGLGYHGAILSRPFLASELPGWAPIDEELVNTQQRHDITIALAVPVLDRKLSFGLNGTLQIRSGEYVRNAYTGNLDVAIAARPIEEFTVALVGADVLPVPDQPDRPARVVLGLRGGKEDLAVGSVDVGVRTEEVMNSAWWVAAGFEGSIKWARLRAGYDWDGERGTHRISWGLGLRAPMGSLSYAMQIPIVTEDFQFSSVTHTVTLTIFTRLGDKQAEEEPPRWGGGLR